MKERNTLIFGKDQAVADWVARRLPDVHNGFGKCAAIAVCTDTKPVAGVVYHSFNAHARTVQMSIASLSPLWAKKTTILELLAVPFLQKEYNCRKVWAMTSSDNLKAIRFLTKIGMSCEAKLRHHYGHKRAAWIFGMMRHEYDALCAEWAKPVEMKEAA